MAVCTQHIWARREVCRALLWGWVEHSRSGGRHGSLVRSIRLRYSNSVFVDAKEVCVADVAGRLGRRELNPGLPRSIERR